MAAARGTHRQDSDADVAVLRDAPVGNRLATALDMTDLAYDTLLQTGINITPLPVGRDECAHPEQHGNPALPRHIEREGIALWRAAPGWPEAARALACARMLLAQGDGDGACNRAHSAALDAARAALAAAGEPASKTHKGCSPHSAGNSSGAARCPKRWDVGSNRPGRRAMWRTTKSGR